MAGCGRFSFVDAGTVQYVIDQWCGRVLQVFGGKPVLEGGPFTLDDAGGEPRLLGRGPSAGTIHLVSDIVPWKLKVDLGPGGNHAITGLAIRGVEVDLRRVYTQRECFALDVACPGGPAFQAQWFHRVAADCSDGAPTRLTCTMKHFMAYLDMGSSTRKGHEVVRVHKRILTVLKYYGVQPGHVRQSYHSRRKQDAIDKVATTFVPGEQEDEFYSITILAMLLSTCRFLPSNGPSSGAKPDPDRDAPYIALLRGLLQWPLRDVPTWGFSMDGVDFFIENGELDLKMLRNNGLNGNATRFLFFWSSVHRPV